MDAELNRRLDYELKLLKDDRARYTRLLENCRGFENMCIRSSKRPNGREYYYARWKGAKQYKYVGTRSHPDVKRICDAHFLKEAIKRIDNNIKMIEKFMEGYLEVDPYSINAALRKLFRRSIAPASQAYQVEGAKWKKEKLAFQATFPENYPEHKTEQTSDGVWVKTVSEVVLYERFKAAGFVQIYELPLVLNDYGPAIYPDFSILSPVDMKTVIYVEYVGRLDLQKYRDDFARKVDRYISNGYIPGVNVFFIYGNKEGHIDSLQINKVIADIRGF